MDCYIDDIARLTNPKSAGSKVRVTGMRMMRVMGFAMGVALCVCSGASGQMHGAGGGTGEQAAQLPTTPNEVAKGPDADKAFLKKAMEANIAEMRMAQLALEKSSDAQIRHFALQMQDDHGKLQDELKQVAAQLNVPVPDEPSKGAAKSMEKMKALSGDAFDQVYIKEMIKAHKDDSKAFKDEAHNTTSPQLKEMMTRDDQMIESHLQEIQQISQSKGKAKG
jgi:putative membrane protein